MARRPSQQWLTVKDILDDLGIPRRTWQQWRELGRVPKYIKLPNGQLRVRRDDYETWLAQLERV
jgi:predicted site-specific integrase-resolvase